ncbi:hypothetical protein [Candidatus Contendibacter odensensis]|uniref:Uncharacterized protein n=1 Tax=Candidatus Contendobacter odensis Run_B_J11 TaxID=1400861 RepID=A0A7U7G952_9GAMM|nr:hypothetical protein [Candidatus Contendobacter odensis]CDH43864.1 conserved hypothetical protein [Candidatus Contendobacter odensis Run_B_J11]
MASGRLGAVDLSANTYWSVYTVPALKMAALSVSVCCRSVTGTLVRLALASTGTPTAAEWIEYDTALTVNQVLERSGLVLDAGKILVAYSSSANVNVVVYGTEETA